MTYQDTLDWMFSQLPMYQRQGKEAFKKDLTNSFLLADHLKNPHLKFKSVHVAGTNGKGSTSHMLASILQEAGYKVGLYTSPHLKDFRERIKVNGKVVTKQFVIGFIKRNTSFFDRYKVSFFEMTVGMAFDYFSKQKVDVAIIEVGLGGRLDSTNIITPEVSVITNIGYDHMQFLGNTLEAIAFEKAGIIKSQVPVVIGESQSETREVFNDIAKTKKAHIYFADTAVEKTYKTDLIGNYQTKNVKTTIQTIRLLQNKGYKISEDNIINGFMRVVNNTGFLGRWQIIQEKPKVICDTAHNIEGLTLVMEQLAEENFKKLHIVFGVVNDKDLSSILHLLPKHADFYFCRPNIPRGLDANDLKETFIKSGFSGEAYLSVNNAYLDALNKADVTDIIYVGGSTFVVAEII